MYNVKCLALLIQYFAYCTPFATSYISFIAIWWQNGGKTFGGNFCIEWETSGGNRKNGGLGFKITVAIYVRIYGFLNSI